MPLVWKNGQQFEGTTAEFTRMLLAVAQECAMVWAFDSSWRAHLNDHLEHSALMIDRLTAENEGWKRTALAMRDAAIFWNRDGKDRYEEIERMYFDAAMFGRWTEIYRNEQ